jgi:hypothetical protein
VGTGGAADWTGETVDARRIAVVALVLAVLVLLLILL